MKGADQCPGCASRRVGDFVQPFTKFYAATIRVCGNCRTSWEPFDPTELVDAKHELLGAFKHPCNNCAFRKGSPERADAAEWASKMLSMDRGASFYCHKGVPVEPESVHGFAYPDEGKNPRKLRRCRGYLNTVVAPRMREYPFDPAEVNSADEPWVDA